MGGLETLAGRDQQILIPKPTETPPYLIELKGLTIEDFDTDRSPSKDRMLRGLLLNGAYYHERPEEAVKAMRSPDVRHNIGIDPHPVQIPIPGDESLEGTIAAIVGSAYSETGRPYFEAIAVVGETGEGGIFPIRLHTDDGTVSLPPGCVYSPVRPHESFDQLVKVYPPKNRAQQPPKR